MPDLQQARRLLNEGNRSAALEVVMALLREDVYNVEAWRLAVTLARTDAEREHAQQQLKRAIEHIDQKAVVVSSETPQTPVQKDYLIQAVVALLLYYAGGGFLGVAANVLFLVNAKNDTDRGIPTKNVGCLQVLLLWHLIGMVSGLVIMIAIIAIYGTTTALSICGFILFFVASLLFGLEAPPAG